MSRKTVLEAETLDSCIPLGPPAESQTRFSLMDKQLPQESGVIGERYLGPLSSGLCFPVTSMDLSQGLSMFRGQAWEGKVTDWSPM